MEIGICQVLDKGAFIFKMTSLYSDAKVSKVPSRLGSKVFQELKSEFVSDFQTPGLLIFK